MNDAQISLNGGPYSPSNLGSIQGAKVNESRDDREIIECKHTHISLAAAALSLLLLILWR